MLLGDLSSVLVGNVEVLCCKVVFWGGWYHPPPKNQNYNTVLPKSSKILHTKQRTFGAFGLYVGVFGAFGFYFGAFGFYFDVFGAFGFFFDVFGA